MFKSVQWLIDHPEFLSNEVYIAGDSYCGIPVPVIVQEISNGIARTNKRIKLYAKVETKLKYIETSLYSNMLVLLWISPFAQFSIPAGNEGGMQPWIYIQVCAFKLQLRFQDTQNSILSLLSSYIIITCHIYLLIPILFFFFYIFYRASYPSAG